MEKLGRMKECGDPQMHLSGCQQSSWGLRNPQCLFSNWSGGFQGNNAAHLVNIRLQKLHVELGLLDHSRVDGWQSRLQRCCHVDLK